MKNFLASLVIVLFAFIAGAYLVPDRLFQSPNTAPAAAPEEVNVKTNVAPERQTETGRAPIPYNKVDDAIYTNHELHTINLFEGASPSVCYITTKTRQRSYWSFNITEVPSGSGSGFVWDESGHIITNYHVIKGATQAVVTLANGQSYQASLVGAAREKDLAVLKIDAPAKELLPIPVGSSRNIRVGQSVYAIGNPFGLDQTLTTGVVSALDREINSQSEVPIRGVIQSDAAINPGNSGGPLLDSGGQLIGVNTAIYSPSGASAGIGFSIPVDVVKYVVPDLINFGEVRRAVIGAEFRPLRRGKGLAFYEVMPGSPAARYGLRGIYRDEGGNLVFGDILTAVNGQPVSSTTDLYLELEKYKPGQTVQLTIIRNEQEAIAEIVLGSSVNR